MNNYQKETIEAQLRAFSQKGYEAQFATQFGDEDTRYHVKLRRNLKAYRFSDPDIEVIIGQLATLYCNQNRLNSVLKAYVNLMNKVKKYD